MQDIDIRCHTDVEFGAPRRGAGPRGNDRTKVNGGAAVSKRGYIIIA